MKKHPLRPSAIREPLSFALSSPGRVAALRTLAGITEGITQRDVSRRAGIQNRSAQVALDDLVRLGIVSRQIGGRDSLVSLNRAHRLHEALLALFARESDHFAELRRDLAEVTAFRGVLSVALFGSVARGVDGPASDCDLLIVARDEEAISSAIDHVGEQAERLRARYGCRVAPIGYEIGEARRRWKSQRAPFRDVRRDELFIRGLPLNEVLGGDD
jgi:predicted nucleotidyltransferase